MQWWVLQQCSRDPRACFCPWGSSGNRTLKLGGISVVAPLHGDFWGDYGGLFHPAPNNPISSRGLLPRPRQGSAFWEQSDFLPGRRKKDFQRKLMVCSESS